MSEELKPGTEFREWFEHEWAMYEDKAFTSRVTSMAWALKAWRHTRAVHPGHSGDEVFDSHEVDRGTHIEIVPHYRKAAPVLQDGDERARFEAWANSNGFGPKYRESMFAAWQAALASNKAAAVAVAHPTPISITTDQIAEIAGKYNLGNPRLDALRGFVNEVIIVNGAEYAKSE
ncbi:hypothetical protein P3T24_004348 [Paraburkholderia sp. GAS33]|uniref:hypothetical protein n=1 Tax=Paraburkholderia sp. GAS33 TaxID=3035130 RepID=UPI003D2383B9